MTTPTGFEGVYHENRAWNGWSVRVCLCVSDDETIPYWGAFLTPASRNDGRCRQDDATTTVVKRKPDAGLKS